jgi:quaternary ammonium compound-resistance protein SugE
MDWLFLAAAGAFEVCWATGLKYTEGFSRITPVAFSLLAMAASIILLGFAVRTIPIGTAYAVWTGIGAVGTAVVGMIAMDESRSPIRLICMGLIISGSVGLKLCAS